MSLRSHQIVNNKLDIQDEKYLKMFKKADGERGKKLRPESLRFETCKF